MKNNSDNSGNSWNNKKIGNSWDNKKIGNSWDNKKNDRSFSKKASTDAPKETNYGWRGSSDSFQSKTENRSALAKQKSAAQQIPETQRTGGAFSGPVDQTTEVPFGESKIGNVRVNQINAEKINIGDGGVGKIKVGGPQLNTGTSSSVGTNAYESTLTRRGAFTGGGFQSSDNGVSESITGTPNTTNSGSDIGNIRINQSHAEKISINGTNIGSENFSGINALSNAGRESQLSSVIRQPGNLSSGGYVPGRSGITINRSSINPRINISSDGLESRISPKINIGDENIGRRTPMQDSGYGVGGYGYGISAQRPRIVSQPRSVEISQIRFNSDVGFKRSVVTQQNLLSADQKLQAASVDIRKLSTGDLKAIAMGGTIRGRNVPLTNEERQTLQAYIKAKESPNSFSTLTANGGEVGGFRRKGSNPMSSIVQQQESGIGHIRIAENRSELGRIKMDGDVSYDAKSGLILARGRDGSGVLGTRQNIIGQRTIGNVSNQSSSGLLDNANGIENPLGVKGTGASLADGGSKIRVIGNLDERSFGTGPRELGKILVTSGDGATGSRALSNVTVGDSNIISNFRINNMIGTGRSSKISINGSPLGGAGKTQKTLKNTLQPQKSVFSKYSNLSVISKKASDIGGSFLSKMPLANGFSMGKFVGSSKGIIAAILAAGVALTSGFNNIKQTFNTYVSNNNYERTDEGLIGNAGALAPNSTLQTILDELDFRQRAYEHNLVCCDEEAEGVYGLSKYATEKKKYYDYGIPESWEDWMEKDVVVPNDWSVWDERTRDGEPIPDADITQSMLWSWKSWLDREGYEYKTEDDKLKVTNKNTKFKSDCGINGESNTKYTVSKVTKLLSVDLTGDKPIQTYKTMGYRLSGHLWGASKKNWTDAGETCVYPKEGVDDYPSYKNPPNVNENPPPYPTYRDTDGLDDDEANKGDNMIRVWYQDDDGDYCYKMVPMYLFCIGGLEKDAGEYDTDDLEENIEESGGLKAYDSDKNPYSIPPYIKDPISSEDVHAHVDHASEAANYSQRKYYNSEYDDCVEITTDADGRETGEIIVENHITGEKEENLGGKENNRITVEYRYEGSEYSYINTENKRSYYEKQETSEPGPGMDEEGREYVNRSYDTYEFYRALLACGEAFCHNGEENPKYLGEYMTRLFEEAMSRATIEIVPDPDYGVDYDSEQFQEAEETGDERVLHWKYVDKIGSEEGLPGKNGAPDGVSYCSSPTYDLLPIKVIITVHDAGVQDLMRLDEQLTDNDEAHKPLIARLIDAIYDIVTSFVSSIKGFFTSLFSGEVNDGDIDLLPISRMFIDEDYIDEHPIAQYRHNDWAGWFFENIEDKEDGAEEQKVSERYLYDKDGDYENLPSQTRYAVDLVEFDKDDFDELYEGIYLPSSNVVFDYVPDEDGIDAPSPGGGGTGDPVPRPDINGGVYLDNLRYINQGTVSFHGKTRYIKDGGDVSTFGASGCLDSSIMMIYYHYYVDNAESVDDGTIESLWNSTLKPTITNGSGMLGTSTVCSKLGISLSGAHYLNKEGWDLATDCLYAGNPVLLHIAGHCDTGSDGFYHKSNGGHWLIIVGFDVDGIYVYDPGCRNNNTHVIKWDDPCWSTLNDVYYKTCGATGETVVSSTATVSSVSSGSLTGITGETLNIPNPGDTVTVYNFNEGKYYTLKRSSTDAYSVQGTVKDASSKWSTVYNRITNAASTASSNNIGQEGQLLTLTKNGQTYYVASLVDGYSKPGEAYRVTLNTGETFNVFSADVKSLNDAKGSGPSNQIDSDYGHGYMLSSGTVQMNIVEFFDANDQSCSEHSSSAKNYGNTPVKSGTYVTKVESLGAF